MNNPINHTDPTGKCQDPDPEGACEKECGRARGNNGRAQVIVNHSFRARPFVCAFVAGGAA